MSGGHFNYDQYKINQIADQIENIIFYNDSGKLDDSGDSEGYGFTSETIKEFKQGLITLRKAFIYAQRIDWLVCGDDGEKKFYERLQNELKQINQENTFELLDEVSCKIHPDAPHGFDRNASHNADRYVCECEGWEPPKREWVGLTDEEIQAERHKLDSTAGWTYDYFARAIETKLKEKNA